MSTTEDLRAAIERARASIATMESQLERLDSIGPEPDDGSIVRFKIRFGNSRVYTYAALRAGKNWYTTATDEAVMSWDALIQWITRSDVTLVEPPVLALDFAPVAARGAEVASFS